MYGVLVIVLLVISTAVATPPPPQQADDAPKCNPAQKVGTVRTNMETFCRLMVKPASMGVCLDVIMEFVQRFLDEVDGIALGLLDDSSNLPYEEMDTPDKWALTPEQRIAWICLIYAYAEAEEERRGGDELTYKDPLDCPRMVMVKMYNVTAVAVKNGNMERAVVDRVVERLVSDPVYLDTVRKETDLEKARIAAESPDVSTLGDPGKPGQGSSPKKPGVKKVKRKKQKKAPAAEKGRAM